MSFAVQDNCAQAKVTTRSSMMRQRPKFHGETRLAPARGILTALALVVPFWAFVCAVVHALT
jgi:hypothetical protein